MRIYITQTEEIRKYIATTYSQSGPYIFVTSFNSSQGCREATIELVTYEGDKFKCKIPKKFIVEEDIEQIKRATPIKKKKEKNPDNPFY